MTQLERLYQLNSSLLNEMPQYKKQALSFRKDEKKLCLQIFVLYLQKLYVRQCQRPFSF